MSRSDFKLPQMTNRILTVPNQLTFLRLGFLPFFIIAILYSHFKWALAILILAGLTDGLDGLLARGLNQKTPLGAYLDPIADKLLLSSSYFVLALKGKLAWWVTILVLSRDVLLLVASAAILVTVGYRPFPPSIWGKITTTLEILLIVVVLLLQLNPSHWLLTARRGGANLVGLFVVISGVHYAFVVAKRLSAGH